VRFLELTSFSNPSIEVGNPGGHDTTPAFLTLIMFFVLEGLLTGSGLVVGFANLFLALLNLTNGELVAFVTDLPFK
jgi:hypothetical protein